MRFKASRKFKILSRVFSGFLACLLSFSFFGSSVFASSGSILNTSLNGASIYYPTVYDSDDFIFNFNGLTGVVPSSDFTQYIGINGSFFQSDHLQSFSNYGYGFAFFKTLNLNTGLTVSNFSAPSSGYNFLISDDYLYIVVISVLSGFYTYVDNGGSVLDSVELVYSDSSSLVSSSSFYAHSSSHLTTGKTYVFDVVRLPVDSLSFSLGNIFNYVSSESLTFNIFYVGYYYGGDVSSSSLTVDFSELIQAINNASSDIQSSIGSASQNIIGSISSESSSIQENDNSNTTKIIDNATENTDKVMNQLNELWGKNSYTVPEGSTESKGSADSSIESVYSSTNSYFDTYDTSFDSAGVDSFDLNTFTSEFEYVNLLLTNFYAILPSNLKYYIYAILVLGFVGVFLSATVLITKKVTDSGG